jgi:tRNA/tmRNA/rRNA uracil-C5-methylase (TrmA/RlmC/RlmD family)
MIVNLKPFVNLPAKVILSRRSDFAAFYQVVLENVYSPILSNIKEGDVVVDAGANIGLFSILASFKVKDKGKVIAIEP